MASRTKSTSHSVQKRSKNEVQLKVRPRKPSKNNGSQGFVTPYWFQILESVGCPEALQALVFIRFSSTYLQLNLIFTTFLSSSLDRTPESCSSLSRSLPKTRFSAFQNSWWRYVDGTFLQKPGLEPADLAIPFLCTRSHFYESLHLHRKSERQVFSTWNENFRWKFSTVAFR